MKTTFSRAFFPAAIVVMVALLIVGAAFQLLVRNVLTRQIENGLQEDCTAITDLAAAYYVKNSLSDEEFFVNLSIATRVSDTDAIICNSKGRLVLCSDSPMGCPHQGMLIDQSYLQQALQAQQLGQQYENMKAGIANQNIAESNQNWQNILDAGTSIASSLAFANAMKGAQAGNVVAGVNDDLTKNIQQYGAQNAPWSTFGGYYG